MEIIANAIVCPHCGKNFVHNRVNGMALLEVVQNVEARKRMHCRLTLDAMERADLDEPTFKAIKKVILDGYNDLARDVHTILGFGTEAE